MNKYYGSIWFWWFVLTFVYVSLNVAGYPMNRYTVTHADVDYAALADLPYSAPRPEVEEISLMTFALNHPIDVVFTFGTAFIGVFVPFGAASVLLLVMSMASMNGDMGPLMAIPVFFILMFVAHKVLKKYEMSPRKKIAVILIALILITMVVDYVRDTPFESWKILMHGSVQDVSIF